MTQTNPRPLRWLQILLLLGSQLAWVMLLAGGLIQFAHGLPAVGVGFIAVGLVTAVLAIRRLRVGLARAGNAEPEPFDRGPEFDYVVWAFVGLPFIGGLVLLILFLIGGSR